MSERRALAHDSPYSGRPEWRKRLAAHERGATAELIHALREVDARRLYLADGYSCMFFYCTKRLHLSEQAAYSRYEGELVFGAR